MKKRRKRRSSNSSSNNNNNNNMPTPALCTKCSIVGQVYHICMVYPPTTKLCCIHLCNTCIQHIYICISNVHRKTYTKMFPGLCLTRVIPCKSSKTLDLRRQGGLVVFLIRSKFNVCIGITLNALFRTEESHKHSYKAKVASETFGMWKLEQAERC